MILKVIILFLVGMGVLAMFGKVKLPRAPRLGAAKCSGCGRFRIGRGDCPCGGGRG